MPQNPSIAAALPAPIAVHPLGDRAVRVSFAEDFGLQTPARLQQFAAHLASLGVDGVEECISAHATVTVFYNPLRLSYGALRAMLACVVPPPPAPIPAAPRTVTLPVRYGGADGPDLLALAAGHGLSVDAAIALHSSSVYEVVMLGFLPGFPYLRGLPDALHTPRLETPRARVPAGSVGIGGAQTGVYPCASPGGWHLIGRTDAALFDPSRDPPSLLQAGDRVRFAPI